MDIRAWVRRLIRELHIRWIYRTETTRKKPFILTPDLMQVAKDAATLTDKTSEEAFDTLLDGMKRLNRDQD